MELQIRFFKHVKKTNGCWLWLGRKGHFGYGAIKINNKYRSAHRVSWEIHNGEIPQNYCVLHKCDTPPCVNPQHLWLGTLAENMNDKFNKRRTARGSRHGRSKLTEEIVKEIKKRRTGAIGEQTRLAKEFGIAQTGISKIFANKTWKHI